MFALDLQWDEPAVVPAAWQPREKALYPVAAEGPVYAALLAVCLRGLRLSAECLAAMRPSDAPSWAKYQERVRSIRTK